jgi:sulfate permease, SulP family
VKLRAQFSLKTLREDAVAGLVLGAQSIPDGLANGLLAGVNPLYGLYAYLVGTFSGALFTSSAFMAVQGTGAMAMVIADVPAIHGAADPSRALFTLSILVGVFMLLAGFFKLGTVLRFVSNAVMVGFINAVGVNIILGQLANLTGYTASGANRVLRALDTLLHPGQLHMATLFIGVATIVLIVLLERTRLGPMGMVVAVVFTSAATAGLGWDVARLSDIARVPNSLPLPQAPVLALVPVLLVPAVALAFVGLVQGAAISANYPNPDGSFPDPSRDFIGQGAANIACGVLQGMPVGGSLSATALGKAAGAKSRKALLIAGVVMAATILLFARLVGAVSMPALAGLLMLVGFRTISPNALQAVWRTGTVQRTVLGATFALTLVIPLQFAVLVGVALSVVLHTVSQSNRVTVKRREFEAHGTVVESDPPKVLPPNEVVILQPYGSLFFAAAPVFDAALPAIAETSHNSVVVLRLRGYTDLGTTFMDVLKRYAEGLSATGSRLVIVSGDDRVLEQLTVTGVTSALGPDGIYAGDERVGATVRRAHDDAVAWIERNQRVSGDGNKPADSSEA